MDRVCKNNLKKFLFIGGHLSLVGPENHGMFDRLHGILKLSCISDCQLETHLICDSGGVDENFYYDRECHYFQFSSKGFELATIFSNCQYKHNRFHKD